MNRERNPGVSQTALSTGSFGCASIHLEGRDSRKLSSLTRKVGERTAKPRRAGGGRGSGATENPNCRTKLPRNQVLGNPGAFKHFGAIRESQLCG